MTQNLRPYVSKPRGILLSLALSLASAACIGAPDEAVPPGESVAASQDALSTDWTCRYDDPDYTCKLSTPTAHCGHTSPDANYGHSLCAHNYIGQFNFTVTTTDSFVTATYAGADLTGSSFPCSAAWVTATLYQQTSSGDWNTFVAAQTEYGQQGTDQCFPPRVFMRAAYAPAVYKVVTQAGIATSYQPVNVEGTNEF